MAKETKAAKKDTKEQKRLYELERENLEKKQQMVRWGVIGAVVVIFLAFFGFLIFSQKQKQQMAENTPITFAPTGHVEGTSSAQLTITEFADLQCPACKAYYPVTQQIMAAYPTQVKLVYKYFPLTMHKHSREAAQAAQAAGNQGKFWKMADLLFTNQNQLDPNSWGEVADAYPFFEKYAKQLNLDMDKFKKDYSSKETADIIQAQVDEGNRVGIIGTPTFFINGKLIQNPAGFPAFKQIIDQELKNTQK